MTDRVRKLQALLDKLQNLIDKKDDEIIELRGVIETQKAEIEFWRRHRNGSGGAGRTLNR